MSLIGKLRDRLDTGQTGQAGDTIVEVMIVLAVLGMAMGVGYATANRSLLNTRQAQESSIATEMAQSQVEALTALGCVSGDPACDPSNAHNQSYQLFHQPTAFCIVNNALPPVPDTDAGCSKDFYHIKITCLNGCNQPHIFEVQIVWDDVLGQGQDTVIQDYAIPSRSALPDDGGGDDGGGDDGGGVSETLTVPPAPRSTTYGALCQLPDNRGSRVYYYSLTGQPCAGGGTFLYTNPTGDLTTYNAACQFSDGRYAYGPTTATLYCPQGSVLRR